jgi:prephenate dehydratase
VAYHLPHAIITEGGSTAAAAAEVTDPLSRFDAAICAQIAGELHGLVPLAKDIADNPDAVTRFVLVSRPGPVGPATGADKTTMFCSCARPSRCPSGILEQFAAA